MPPMTPEQLEASRLRRQNAKEMEAAGNSAVTGFSPEQEDWSRGIFANWEKKIEEPEYKEWQKQKEKQDKELEERGVVRVNTTMNHNPEPVLPRSQRGRKPQVRTNTQPRKHVTQPARYVAKEHVKPDNAPIAKQFSYQVTGHFWKSPENIATVHLLYVEAVLRNKALYTEGELSRVFNSNRKPTSTEKDRAIAAVEKLKEENLDFVKIKKIDNDYEIVFEQSLIEDTTIRGRYQFLRNDFIKNYAIFYGGEKKKATKVEIGGMLLLAHYILPNKHHRSFIDNKPHRLYFRTAIESGCFSRYLIERKDYSIMRNILTNRFKIFEMIGFIEAVSFSIDMRKRSGGSGNVSWLNNAKVKLTAEEKIEKAKLKSGSVLGKALCQTLSLVQED